MTDDLWKWWLDVRSKRPEATPSSITTGRMGEDLVPSLEAFFQSHGFGFLNARDRVRILKDLEIEKFKAGAVAPGHRPNFKGSVRRELSAAGFLRPAAARAPKPIPEMEVAAPLPFGEPAGEGRRFNVREASAVVAPGAAFLIPASAVQLFEVKDGIGTIVFSVTRAAASDRGAL